jgi:predicted N-formylglutamate amidohydrolase
MTRFVLEHSDFSPYEIINPDGSAPVLVACDHADNRIPLSLHGLGLDPVHLENHIAYDIGAREVALKLSRLFDAPLLLANYSRLVVDLNRHLDDPTLLVEQSDGIDIPGNQNLDAEKRDQRVRNYFQPYHDQYACMVSRLAAHHKSPMILAIHSFTPTFNGYLRPWDFGVLWDQSEELAKKHTPFMSVRHLGISQGICPGGART